jgi:hypothetical protein
MTVHDAPCTPESLWSALRDDPDFQSEVPAGRPQEIFRELIEQVPSVLADLIHQPVTFRALLLTRKTFLCHMVETKFLSRLAVALDSELPDGLTAEFVGAGLDAGLAFVAGQYIALVAAEDPRVLLEADGETEDELLEDPELGGLNQLSMAMYRGSGLTIGQLLLNQPMALFEISEIEDPDGT